MMNRGVAMAFERWLENAAESKKNRGIIRKVAFRFRQAAVVAAFVRWVDIVQEMKHQTTVLNKVLITMTKKAMVCAFRLWVDNVEEMRSKRGVTGKVITMLMNRGMARAFARWCEVTASVKRARSCIVKMMRRGLACALQAWKQFVHEQARQLSVLGNVVSRLQNRGMATAFEAWRQGAEEARRSAAIIGKILNRMKQVGLVRSFNCWASAMSRTRSARRVIARLRSASLARIFDRWRESVGEGRAIMQVVAERFAVHDPERANELRMCRTLRGWSDACISLGLNRVRALAIIGRRHDASLASQIMQCWKDEVVEAREECMSIVRVSVETLSSHFAAWKQVLEEISMLSRGIVECASTWRARFMSRMLDDWAVSAQLCRQEARVKAALEVADAWKPQVPTLLVLEPEIQRPQHSTLDA